MRKTERRHTGAVKVDKLPRQKIVKEKGEVSRTMSKWGGEQCQKDMRA